jgi:hypothetical protein
MCPAIHIISRSWLRSSSTHEPSDPPPKVVIVRHVGFLRGAIFDRPTAIGGLKRDIDKPYHSLEKRTKSDGQQIDELTYVRIGCAKATTSRT